MMKMAIQAKLIVLLVSTAVFFLCHVVFDRLGDGHGQGYVVIVYMIAYVVGLVAAIIGIPISLVSIAQARGDGRAIIFAGAYGLASLSFIWFLCVWPMYGPSITKEKAMERFERQTGISIADEMAILGFKNDHRGMNGDGEFGMVVTMSPARIATILRGPPPFGKSWCRGPVTGEIGCHCAFIYAESPGVETARNTPPQYFGGSPEVSALLSSKDVVYCAQSRGPVSIPWHNGTLLVVRPSDGTLWLSEWDF